MKILKKVDNYRIVENGIIFSNKMPDCRIQRRNQQNFWKDEFLLDNSIQLNYAMNDERYMKYLCGELYRGKSDES
jgi:hypothetical protein